MAIAQPAPPAQVEPQPQAPQPQAPQPQAQQPQIQTYFVPAPPPPPAPPGANFQVAQPPQVQHYSQVPSLPPPTAYAPPDQAQQGQAAAQPQSQPTAENAGEPAPELTADERVQQLQWQNGSLMAILAHAFPEADLETEWQSNVALMNDGSYRYIGELTAQPEPPEQPQQRQQTPRQRMQAAGQPPRAPMAIRAAGNAAASEPPSPASMTPEALAKHYREVVQQDPDWGRLVQLAV